MWLQVRSLHGRNETVLDTGVLPKISRQNLESIVTRAVSSRVSIIYLSICRGRETGDILYASGQAQDIILACKKPSAPNYWDAMKIAAIVHLFLCFVMGKDRNSLQKLNLQFFFLHWLSSQITSQVMNEFINVEKSHIHVSTYVLFQPSSPWLTWPAQLWPSSWKQLSIKYPWLKC